MIIMLTIEPSMPECAFFTVKTVNYEKVDKRRISGSHEGNFFRDFFVFVFISMFHAMWLKWLGA